MDTYLPAVQTANDGEDTAGGAMQPHVVSLQDEVTQLQAMQGLALGRVQATHQAAGADVNGALEEEKEGILPSTSLSAPQHTQDPGPCRAALPLPRSLASPAGGSAAGHSQHPDGLGLPAGS